MIKTRSQSAGGTTTAEATKSVLIDYGIRGFWRGTTMRLGRTIFSGGILFTSYEAAVRLIMPLYEGHGNFMY
jgi:solute carrier family 25 citrate transporter 1